MGSLTDLDKSNIIEATMEDVPDEAREAFRKHIKEQKKLQRQQ